MRNILEVADAEELIVNGYAFTKTGNNIKVLDLNNPEKAAFLSQAGDVMETTIENVGQLSDREVRIIRGFIKDNYKEMYMKWSQKSDNGFYGE